MPCYYRSGRSPPTLGAALRRLLGNRLSGAPPCVGRGKACLATTEAGDRRRPQAETVWPLLWQEIRSCLPLDTLTRPHYNYDSTHVLPNISNERKGATMKKEFIVERHGKSFVLYSGLLDE